MHKTPEPGFIEGGLPWPWPWPDSCADNTCTDASVGPDGVTLTSTAPGNDGRVTYTQNEWDQFVYGLLSGKWTHTLSPEARQRVAPFMPAPPNTPVEGMETLAI